MRPSTTIITKAMQGGKKITWQVCARYIEVLLTTAIASRMRLHAHTTISNDRKLTNHIAYDVYSRLSRLYWVRLKGISISLTPFVYMNMYTPTARVPSIHVRILSHTTTPAHARINQKYRNPSIKLAPRAPRNIDQHTLISANTLVRMLALTACTTDISVGSGMQMISPTLMLLYSAGIGPDVHIEPRQSTFVLAFVGHYLRQTAVKFSELMLGMYATKSSRIHTWVRSP